jgi:hypothetical protein
VPKVNRVRDGSIYACIYPYATVFPVKIANKELVEETTVNRFVAEL